MIISLFATSYARLWQGSRWIAVSDRRKAGILALLKFCERIIRHLANHKAYRPLPVVASEDGP